MASQSLAVLFADVCESTTIYETLGDARALEVISRLFETLTARVKAQGGEIVKTLGDGMVCQFQDADAAFEAACDIQAAANAADDDGPKLAIKVGFNWGPVVTERGDVFGDTVNVCARLAALAGAHQVLTTQATIDALSPALRDRSRHLYEMNVRGRVEEVSVCEVLWRADPDMTRGYSGSFAIPAARDFVLKLVYGGDTVTVEASGSVRIGRDPSNDLVIPSSRASRVHASVQGRGGNFVIADQSSNGTFVLVDGASRELHLKRGEAPLGERGYIGLGAPVAGHGDHVLRYRLEARRGG